jgi:predicted extracellular nuclease
MKRILPLILFIFCCACAQPASYSFKDYETVAVAFYNVENLFHPDDDPFKHDEDFTPDGLNHYTAEVYAQKLQNMARALSQIAIDKIPEGPAFFGIAEIENEKVLQDLVKEPTLAARNLQIVHFESPDTRGIDVALLYNPSFFKVLDAKAVPVDISENGKKEFTRDILYVKGLLVGDTTHVMVCHWPSRRGGEAASNWKRVKAAEVCKNLADKIFNEDKNARIIIMGDLNDDPINESVAKVIGAKGKMKDVRKEGFFNPWLSLYRKGIGTLSYNDSWNLFDQILVSESYINPKGLQWRYKKAEIFDRAFLRTAFGKYKGYPHRSFSDNTWIDGYSDHFPTIIYFSKMPAPSAN